MSLKIFSMGFSIPEIEDLDKVKKLLHDEYQTAKNLKSKYQRNEHLILLKEANEFMNTPEFKYSKNSIVQIFIVNNVSHIYYYISDCEAPKFYRMCFGNKIEYRNNYISMTQN